MISDIEIINSSTTNEMIPNCYIRDKVRIEHLNEFRQQKNLKEVHLDNLESRVEYLIKLARYSKQNAVQYLLQSSNKHGSFKSSPSFDLLKKIRVSRNLSTFESEDLASLLLVLADATDDMSRINGPVALCERNIFRASGWVAEEVIALLPEKTRTDVVLKAISNGKAASWIFYLVLEIHKKVIIIARNSENEEIGIPSEEIERYISLAMNRLFRILKDGFHTTSNPYYLFKFWWEVSSTDERKNIKKWIKENVVTDMEFLRFVDAFYEKKVFMESIKITDIRWKIQIREIELFISLDYVKMRLSNITVQKNDKGDVARELLNRIEYAEVYEKEVEAGIHSRWSYRKY